MQIPISAASNIALSPARQPVRGADRLSSELQYVTRHFLAHPPPRHRGGKRSKAFPCLEYDCPPCWLQLWSASEQQDRCLMCAPSHRERRRKRHHTGIQQGPRGTCCSHGGGSAACRDWHQHFFTCRYVEGKEEGREKEKENS